MIREPCRAGCPGSNARPPRLALLGALRVLDNGTGKEPNMFHYSGEQGRLLRGCLGVAMALVASCAAACGCARKSREAYQGDSEQLVNSRLETLARLFGVSFVSRTIWVPDTNEGLWITIERYERGRRVAAPSVLGRLGHRRAGFATVWVAAMPDGCEPGKIKMVINFPEIRCSWKRQLRLPASWPGWVLAVSSEVADLELDSQVPVAAVHDGVSLAGGDEIPLSWFLSQDCERGALVVFVGRRAPSEQRE